MIFLHLADLHLGKRLHNFSLLEDQTHILQEILHIVDEKKPDAVLICGDVYDKSIPPQEAVTLFDSFLTDLAKRKQPIFIISGNHDSPERLAFGANLMKMSDVYISSVYQKEMQPIPLKDAFGEINVYMLPFIKPIHVKNAFPDSAIESYTDAVKTALDAGNVDNQGRNILLAHQFVQGGMRAGSEDTTTIVGGLDNVSPSVFDAFDFVALGHLHSWQRVTREGIQYAGTPLKYSLSERKDKKTVTLIDMQEKGNITYTRLPLVPMRDICHLKGTFQELMNLEFIRSQRLTNYFYITLTDELEIPDGKNKMSMHYENILQFEYDNQRTRANASFEIAAEVEQKTPFQLFSDFFSTQTGQSLTNAQETFVTTLIEKIWEVRE